MEESLKIENVVASTAEVKSVNRLIQEIAILRDNSGECKNPYQYSPLALAYIGDSVLDLMVKTYFVVHTNKQTSKYHKDVSNIVKAVNQARFIDGIAETLTEDETDIYKRGRNANTHSKAKNATMGEYRKATGLEALFGYLYLKGDVDRLETLVDSMIKEYEKQS